MIPNIEKPQYEDVQKACSNIENALSSLTKLWDEYLKNAKNIML